MAGLGSGSGLWIRLQVGMPAHPKAVRLCRRLGNPLAWAYVVNLWRWAHEWAPSGVLPSDPADIAAAAQFPGDPVEFLEALVDAGGRDPLSSSRLPGWVDVDAGGVVSLHDWHATQGRFQERRAADRERLKRWRADAAKRSGEKAEKRGRNADETRFKSVSETGEAGNETGETEEKRVSSQVKKLEERKSVLTHTLARASETPFQLLDEAEAEESLGRYLDLLREHVPHFRAEFDVARALFEMRALLPPLEEFRRAVLAHAASGAWRENGGRYVKSAEKLVRGGFWRDAPAPGREGSRRGSAAALAGGRDAETAAALAALSGGRS